METNEIQPKKDLKRTAARLAKSNLLNGFDDLHIIDRFSERFGLHPDEVYYNTDFGTITNFLVMWKEQEEYQERYSYIWEELNKPAAK